MKLTSVLFLAVVTIASLTSQSAFSESSSLVPVSSQTSDVKRPSLVDDLQSGIDPGGGNGNTASAEQLKAKADAARSASTMVHLDFDSFDLYVPEDYYNAYMLPIYQFFFEFGTRLAYLEHVIGWSSEMFYGNKLQMTIYVLSDGCHSAGGGNGTVELFFPDPFYKPSCFSESEISDTAQMMAIVMRQAVHAIMPPELFYRPWLDYGFPAYWAYNALVPFQDITQEQADSMIFAGISELNWDNYVSNDYRDVLNNEIQESFGADITAWMFTMLVHDYSLSWYGFFRLFNNNLETLAKADSLWEISPYYPDMFVIDLFGRAMNKKFDYMKQIFEYSGPSGPGWGVRQWADLDWYGDLSCDFAIESLNLGEANLIPGVVRNTGQVNYEDVLVRFYADDSLLSEQAVDVPAGGTVDVSASLTPSVVRSYRLTLYVNQGWLKVESDIRNNRVDRTVQCTQCCGYYAGGFTGNTDCSVDGKMKLGDVVRLIDRVYLTRQPLCCEENGNVDGDSEGAIDLSDITLLIDHIYLSKQATAVCE